MKEITTNSEKETRDLGARLWRENKEYLGKQAVVFALEGELGTGKTQYVKGLAKAMSIKDEVISPTFTLEAEYDLGRLIHIDAWRIEDPEELLEIGFGKRIKEKKIIVIEWADQAREVIDKIKDNVKIVRVVFKYGKGENERIIKFAKQ